MTALLWCTFALDLVAGGQARARLEPDGSRAAALATETLRRHVVLMTGVAVARGAGAGPTVQFARTDFAGYEIRATRNGVIVSGDDPVRAAYDLLRNWGCRFGSEPHIPKKTTLAIRPGSWRREHTLYHEADRFDPSFPTEGIAVRGLSSYQPLRFSLARELGRKIRVASTTFDDFLPPALFREHPEWFARRGEQRVARGNFALENAAARAEYLNRVAVWLEKRPEVEVLGLWPEVTTVWDDDALALGAPEAYALLWREAAARFPERRFEILATGLTLRPPAAGERVPKNVEIRLRPGRDASGLQPLAAQEIHAVVRAWEARGARVVLEIDSAPDAWCGMPWPCHEAVRGDARRFDTAILRGGSRALARIWHAPDAPLSAHLDNRMQELVERARSVKSWGHPADAADLFKKQTDGDAFRIAAVERLFRLARNAKGEEGRSAAHDLYLAYAAVQAALPERHAATYRRYRGRAYRALIERLLPGGVTHKVGPARITEDFENIIVETPRLRLGIERRTATVTSLRRKLAKGWSKDLAGDDGHFFAVTALAQKVDRGDGEVEVTSPATGRIRVVLRGRLNRAGSRFDTTLELGGDGLIRQRSSITVTGGIACGSRWTGGPMDRWICPAYAMEGRFAANAGQPRGLPMPPRTLLYARAGERGVGLALRVGAARRTMVTIVPDPAALAVVSRTEKTIAIEWIVFSQPAELGR